MFAVLRKFSLTLSITTLLILNRAEAQRKLFRYMLGIAALLVKFYPLKKNAQKTQEITNKRLMDVWATLRGI